ncbi:MAG TPA: CBS domain-containing protein [Ornithinimicrobium sp.]|uniref:CBS domain-containing protein n=1 Tax=Ornithinimicrobium sp. TaxID=1977084 RepID=UPI002B45ACB2|nr:CBS domain-containing protein [Ornithinimicrobium sp.]HKJ12793.1 CBS domain-containing protein [Ornithinimicrobium sp.]
MRIGEVLRRKGSDVTTLRPEASVSELVTLLAREGIGSVVVSDDEHPVAGIVSERDIVRGLHDHGARVLDEPVSVIMTSEVHTCGPHDDLETLAGTMTEHRIRHLPVVSDGQLRGIVSIGDIVKGRIAELQSERDQLFGYIQQ